MTATYTPQTAVMTMARIAAGVDPWIAYRDFLEDWTYLPASRIEMTTAEPRWRVASDRRWAALLAATIEALCDRDNVPAPAWIHDPTYRLATPWYLYEGAGRIKNWMRETTPPPFASRNIWSGNRLLSRI